MRKRLLAVSALGGFLFTSAAIADGYPAKPVRLLVGFSPGGSVDIVASQMFFYPGFWKMAAQYYKMGFGEFFRSFSKKAFVKALQKLVPEIQEEDIEVGGAGVRAQALEPNGKLVDDFRIVEANKMVRFERTFSGSDSFIEYWQNYR